MRHRKKLIALAIVVLGPIAAHLVVDVIAHVEPPRVAMPSTERMVVDDVSTTGKGWSAKRGVHLVHLEGSPEEIGAQHATMLRERMVADEQELWDGFANLVPFWPARVLMFDLGRIRYLHVADGMPEARRRELAAQALAFQPDPFASKIPTYQRLVTLHALYDIALGFEHSPLLGCTAFAIPPADTGDGHALFARVFDFEATEIHDRGKVVFLVHEDGKIPFVSVAWPGLAGVLTGMNAEGVAMAVHGGRAREPSTTGMPTVLSVREALSSARDTREAIEILKKHPVMVSHIVFVADASGRFARIERAPGADAFVKETTERVGVTNHFEGPFADDPRNVDVRNRTTSVPRKKRIDQLLAELEPGSGSVPRAVAILRDHGCADDASCMLGDRRAIDAFIATHGVVADLTTKTLWVSEGPHLSGRFVRIDPSLLERGNATIPGAFETLAADPVLGDDRYEQARRRAGGPMLRKKP
jgi:hypothetical protein